MKRLIDIVGTALVAAFLVLIAAIVVGPFLYSITMSVDPRTFLGPFPPPGISGRWYVKFFADERYLRALWVSFALALIAGMVATALGTLAALGLSRMQGSGRMAVDGLFASPKLVPHVVIGFSILVGFSAVGLGSGFFALACVHMLVALPFVVRAVAAALVGIRPSLVEAAMSLGATRRQAVWDIVLPLARTGIAVGFVFAVAVSLDEVSASVFLTSPAVVTLPVILVSDMKASFDLTIAAAAAMMVLLAATVVFALDRIVGIERLLGRGAFGGGTENPR